MILKTKNSLFLFTALGLGIFLLGHSLGTPKKPVSNSLKKTNTESLIRSEDLENSLKKGSQRDALSELLSQSRTELNSFAENVPSPVVALTEEGPQEDTRNLASLAPERIAPHKMVTLEEIKALKMATFGNPEEAAVSSHLADSLRQNPSEMAEWIESNQDFFQGENAPYLNHMLSFPYSDSDLEKILTAISRRPNSEIMNLMQKKLYSHWYLIDPKRAQEFAQKHPQMTLLKNLAQLQTKRFLLKEKLGWEPVYPAEEVISRDPQTAAIEKELRQVLLEIEKYQ